MQYEAENELVRKLLTCLVLCQLCGLYANSPEKADKNDKTEKVVKKPSKKKKLQYKSRFARRVSQRVLHDQLSTDEQRILDIFLSCVDKACDSQAAIASLCDDLCGILEASSFDANMRDIPAKRVMNILIKNIGAVIRLARDGVSEDSVPLLFEVSVGSVLPKAPTTEAIGAVVALFVRACAVGIGAKKFNSLADAIRKTVEAQQDLSVEEHEAVLKAIDKAKEAVLAGRNVYEGADDATKTLISDLLSIAGKGMSSEIAHRLIDSSINNIPAEIDPAVRAVQISLFKELKEFVTDFSNALQGENKK